MAKVSGRGEENIDGKRHVVTNTTAQLTMEYFFFTRVDCLHYAYAK